MCRSFEDVNCTTLHTFVVLSRDNIWYIFTESEIKKRYVYTHTNIFVEEKSSSPFFLTIASLPSFLPLMMEYKLAISWKQFQTLQVSFCSLWKAMVMGEGVSPTTFAFCFVLFCFLFFVTQLPSHRRGIRSQAVVMVCCWLPKADSGSSLERQAHRPLRRVTNILKKLLTFCDEWR